MNVIQSLGVAAAGMMMALSASGAAPCQIMARIAAEAHARFEPAGICANELAAFLKQRYHVLAALERDGEHVRAQAEAEAHNGAPDPQHVAAQLSGGLNPIHRDAPLRATSSAGSESGRRALRAPQGFEPVAKARAIDDWRLISEVSLDG